MTAGPSGHGEPPPATRETPPAPPDEPPPILGSWRTLYAIVLGELILVILVCHWITVRRP